jgi:hypothetical protein
MQLRMHLIVTVGMWYKAFQQAAVQHLAMQLPWCDAYQLVRFP